MLPLFTMAAVLVEVLTGIVKTTIEAFGVRLLDWMDQALSMALALMVAVLGKMNFFEVVAELTGMTLGFPPAFGMFLAALVLARGSNGVHDIFKKLNPSPDNMRIW